MGGKQKFNTELCRVRVVVDFLSYKAPNMRGRIKVTDIWEEEKCKSFLCKNWLREILAMQSNIRSYVDNTEKVTSGLEPELERQGVVTLRNSLFSQHVGGNIFWQFFYRIGCGWLVVVCCCVL